MSYTAAVAGLHALAGELAGTRRKFELDHMRALMHALGDPQLRFTSVLIAGTNGKGSTAATLASIVAASGYRTGLYTSPHLLRVNERVQLAIGGSLQPIADESFAALFTRVRAAAERAVNEGALPQLPSFFEVVTAMAFCAFADAGVDLAVLEVGLGGRLDATNIVEPLVSVITDISLDHTEWLGSTITAIAREKAGILRPGGVLVTLPQHPEANAAIGEVAVALDVTGINAAEYLPGHSPRLQAAADEAVQVPAFGTLLQLAPQLQGEHQRRNLALALAAAETLATRFGFDRITAATATAGVAHVRWPGRLERATVPGGAPVLLDVAHNPAGVWTLRSHLSRLFQTAADMPAPRTLVFSALADKAADEMAQILFPLFDEPGDRVLLPHIDNPRATSVDALHALAASLAERATHTSFAVLPSAQRAYDGLRQQTHGSIVVAGSVYLVSEWQAAAESDAPTIPTTKSSPAANSNATAVSHAPQEVL